jgi:hypothetical protein
MSPRSDDDEKTTTREEPTTTTEIEDNRRRGTINTAQNTLNIVKNSSKWQSA